MSQYWVVGASWDGVHKDAKFVKEGYWMLGWEKGSQADKAASEMKSGDRIAIKRMKGKGQKGIKIRHVGIIKGVLLEANKVTCTVTWVATNLNRNIAESRGCFKSIHGPFEYGDKWVREVFCL